MTSVPSRPHSSPRRGLRYSAGWCSTHSGSSAMPSRNCPFCSGVQGHDRTARLLTSPLLLSDPLRRPNQWLGRAALQVDVLGRIEGDQTLSDRVVERLAQRRLDAVRGRSRRSPIRRQGIELLAELAPDRAGARWCGLVRASSAYRSSLLAEMRSFPPRSWRTCPRSGAHWGVEIVIAKMRLEVILNVSLAIDAC